MQYAAPYDCEDMIYYHLAGGQDALEGCVCHCLMLRLFTSVVLPPCSDLVVTTRHQSQPVASRIEYDSNGTIRSVSKCAREQGTTLSLQRLFHSLPVRHKEFLKNLKKVGVTPRPTGGAASNWSGASQLSEACRIHRSLVPA